MVFTLLPRDTSFFDLFDQLAGKVLDAARALEEMLERWDRLEMRVREMKDLEHESDDILRLALKRLFERQNGDVLEVIKLKEIYEKLESAVDRCEDVANVIQAVVLRHT